MDGRRVRIRSALFASERKLELEIVFKIITGHVGLASPQSLVVMHSLQ